LLTNLKKWYDCGRRWRSTLKIVEELVAVVTARAGTGPDIMSAREDQERHAPFRPQRDPRYGLGFMARKRKHRTKVARITAASMLANPAPMQMRGPPPNGRKT